MTGMEHNLLIRNVLLTYLPITILVSLTSTAATFINTFIVAISCPSVLTYYINAGSE